LRRSAESCVRYLRGVKGVTDLITVKPNVEAKDLKRKIDESIKRHAALDAERIVVNVDDGEVTLGGTVRSWTERHDAERTAWAGPGVRSVTNHLEVRSIDAGPKMRLVHLLASRRGGGVRRCPIVPVAAWSWRNALC
jgi:osmotically-inducible protein OsmY